MNGSHLSVILVDGTESVLDLYYPWCEAAWNGLCPYATCQHLDVDWAATHARSRERHTQMVRRKNWKRTGPQRPKRGPRSH